MGKSSTKSKKTKSKKEKQEFVPGTETEEQFDRVLSLLSEWIKAGIVDYELDSDGDIRFNLPSEMRDLLGKQTPSNLTHENVLSIIRNEIPALVSACLQKRPERRLRHLLPEQLQEKIDEMVDRSKKVFDVLINKNMKQRILLRRTTPCYIVEKIQSIESTYRVESEKGEKIGIPHFSLEFTFTRPRSERMMYVSPIEPMVTFGRKDNIKVTVDLHKDDIKDLINKLSKIAEDIGE